MWKKYTNIIVPIILIYIYTIFTSPTNTKTMATSSSTSPSSRPKRSEAEIMNAPKKLARNMVTLSYKESFKQWLWAPSLPEAEDKLLKMIPGIPPDRIVQHTRTPIEISSKILNPSCTKQETILKDQYLNEYAILSAPEVSSSSSSESFQNIKENEKKVIVMMHGYGAGLAFFFKNFGPLATGLGSDWNLYALDWLGYGNSSRPKFQIKTTDLSETREIDIPSPLSSSNSTMTTNKLKENLAVRETEDWFVESLEAWRKAKKIEKFTLMGHSMGGYLAACYSFRYPQHVEKLIMVSPVGVERGYNPKLGDDERSFKAAFFGTKKKSEEEEEKKLDKEFKGEPKLKDEISKPQDEIQSSTSSDIHRHGSTISSSSSHQSSRRIAEKEKEEEEKYAEYRRIKFDPKMKYFWNSHISPFSILRSSMFFAPRIVSTWSFNRFNGFTTEERDAMHLYAYRLMTAKGSGEYAITRLLAPGVLPRMPLIDRIGETFGLLKCPSLWLYGDQDWMNSNAGREAVNVLNDLDKKVKESLVNEKVDRKSEFVEIPNAGHHLYLDNPPAFNDAIIRYLKKE